MSLHKYSTQNINDLFIRNTLSISAVEFFWGLGLPVIFESAFLQIFLKQIGASNKTIGLIPSILATGVMLFSLMSAWLTSHLVHKKRAVVLSHLAASVPFLLFGLFLPVINESHRVTLFIICYIIFALTLGIIMPLWQNFTVKIFSPGKTIQANSMMIITQVTAKLLGSLVIFKSVEQYSFSIKYSSIIFITVGMLFFAGSFFFLIVQENPGTVPHSRLSHHNIESLTASALHIFRNRNYLKYLAGSIEVHATIAVLSFYANYAVEFKYIDKSIAAGIFVACIYFSGVLTNIMLGWFNLFSLKTKFIAARISAITGTIMLIIAGSLPLFLMSSLLFGISRGVNQSSNAPAVKILSGLDDATDYFAISYVIIFPFSFGIPFAAGLLIDMLSCYNDFAYLTVFIILASLQTAGLFFTIYTDFNPRACIIDSEISE